MLYISTRIPYRQLGIDGVRSDDNIEQICVELILEKNDRWALCHIYKNPNTKRNVFENFFENISNYCLAKYDNSMFIGDMNYNMLNPQCLLHDLCSSYGFVNVITSPTCVKSQNPTLIDVMLVTEKNRLFNGFSYDIGVSDYHYLIGAALRKHIPKKLPET